jgi:hypothetical protein
MNAVSAETLMSTSTALTLALSLVPIISSQVTSRAMTSAGRLIRPPGAPPSASGPAVSHAGIDMPNVSPRIVPVK